MIIINKLIKTLSIILVFTILFTSCYDKIELEDRSFVLTIGIDKNDDINDVENPIKISITTPDTDSLSGKETSKKTFHQGTGSTITTTMNELESTNSKKLYYGQTKCVLISDSILKDAELFKETIDFLERSTDISRKVIILSVKGDTSTILKTEEKDNSLAGVFITNYYANNSKTVGIAFKQDLENMLASLRFDSNVIIPNITNESGLKINKAALIKDFAFKDWLSPTDTKGLLWFMGRGKGMDIIAEYKTKTPLSVSKQKNNITFSEKNDVLECNFTSDIKGEIKEYQFSNSENSDLENEIVIESLKKQYETEVLADINKTFLLMQNTFNTDGFGIKEKLMKKDYTLYKKYSKDWDNSYKNMKLISTVNVDIIGTGSLK